MAHAIFDTHGGDSVLNDRSGQAVDVVRLLGDDECDYYETGPMFHIKFEDGFETSAFMDELDWL